MVQQIGLIPWPLTELDLETRFVLPQEIRSLLGNSDELAPLIAEVGFHAQQPSLRQRRDRFADRILLYQDVVGHLGRRGRLQFSYRDEDLEFKGIEVSEPASRKVTPGLAKAPRHPGELSGLLGREEPALILQRILRHYIGFRSSFASGLVQECLSERGSNDVDPLRHFD